MGISLNSCSIAEARYEGIHGMRVAGGYMLRLSLAFNVPNWDQPVPPVVVFGPSRVFLNDAGGLLLGVALPEVPQPFRVTSYGQTSRLLFDLHLTPSAMETLERLRNGQGFRLKLKLQPEIRTTTELTMGFEDVHCIVNIADWLVALEQTQFGKSMLFEVPLPGDVPGLEVVGDRMEAARRHLTQGHYSEVVAACRLALEALTKSLGQQADMTAALQLHKAGKQQLNLVQRELFMRQALMDFSSLAHHDTGVPLGELFDRNAAQMALGSTAALVSSALSQRAAGLRTV
jgi:hypothetical protein